MPKRLTRQEIELMARVRDACINEAKIMFGSEVTARALLHIENAFSKNKCFTDLDRYLKSRSNNSRSENIAYSIFITWIKVLNHEFGYIPEA